MYLKCWRWCLFWWYFACFVCKFHSINFNTIKFSSVDWVMSVYAVITISMGISTANYYVLSSFPNWIINPTQIMVSVIYNSYDTFNTYLPMMNREAAYVQLRTANPTFMYIVNDEWVICCCNQIDKICSTKVISFNGAVEPSENDFIVIFKQPCDLIPPCRT